MGVQWQMYTKYTETHGGPTDRESMGYPRGPVGHPRAITTLQALTQWETPWKTQGYPRAIDGRTLRGRWLPADNLLVYGRPTAHPQVTHRTPMACRGYQFDFTADQWAMHGRESNVRLVNAHLSKTDGQPY